MTFNPPEIAGLTWQVAAPLGPRTTYKVGGPADFLAEVASETALTALLHALTAQGVPFAVIGNGSNLLVSDAGYRGCAIILGEAFKTIALEKAADGSAQIVAGAAVSITKLLRFAKASGVKGLHRLGGIPGTVGGAVKMNAGTKWGESVELLRSATICSATGCSERPVDELGLSYRHSDLGAGEVITAATFDATDADAEALAAYDMVLDYRKQTQPLQYPSCGSVFANPPGDSAGRLIEAAGLKGKTIGGACIAEQHANWIINLGGATAADVRGLITLAQTRVQAEFGVSLRPEVQFLGVFNDLAGGMA